MPQQEGSASLGKLLAIMRTLRDPASGCPWDLQQSFTSIAPHTLEEAYEVVDAIEAGDMQQLKGELGDLLFQVVFYAQLGSEQALFDFDAIAAGISEKLLRRHPHVFPGGVLQGSAGPAAITAEQVAGTWEEIKADERQQKAGRQIPSALDDVPLALAALPRAGKLQKRAAAEGFDWHDSRGVVEKMHEELVEFEEAVKSGKAEEMEEEFGDLLFTLVNLARHLHLDAESALRRATRKFEQRFRSMEVQARADGCRLRELDVADLDVRWEQAKSRLKKR
jgi:nucleoside triphosphate diphosphatase